jgi:toxin ParE1/3/4
MRRRIIPSPDAEADLESAKRWYQLKEAKLSSRFRMETQKALRRIVRNPLQFPIVYEGVRRALLKRFPYSIYFTLNKDSVFVIAVVHQRRSVDAWLSRLQTH